MTHQFTPDVTFVLGPPADPDFRARFERAQDEFCSGRDGTHEESCILLEPRIPFLLEDRDGGPSIFSETVSLALGTPVRIVEPFLAFSFSGGQFFAQLLIRAQDVRGPAEAVDRLFADGEPAHAIASLLGLFLKLDWVRCSLALPPEPEGEDAVGPLRHPSRPNGDGGPGKRSRRPRRKGRSEGCRGKEVVVNEERDDLGLQTVALLREPGGSRRASTATTGP